MAIFSQNKIREFKRRLIEVARNIEIELNEVNELADEIDAYIMKKTTQRSPEWNDRTNRI